MSAASFAVPTDLSPDLAHRWEKLRRKELRPEARHRRWAAFGGHPLRGWRLPAMILAFILFWPIGLALLAWFFWRSTMSCRTAGSFAPWAAPWKQKVRDHVSSLSSTGNLAFDEYRAATLARLEEERRKLDAQQAEFAEFMKNLRRAKDQEEFDRFMQDRGGTA